MANPFGEYARKYYEQGLSIIPLLPNSKKPFLEGWQKYCTEMVSSDVLAQWELEYSKNNIGVCLGPASGLMAIDFDKGSQELARDLLTKLPRTEYFKKGLKGWTAFYQYNDAVKNKDKFFQRLGVDILSLGSQTVLPPSIHPETMKPYHWLSHDDIFSGI